MQVLRYQVYPSSDELRCNYILQESTQGWIAWNHRTRDGLERHLDHERAGWGRPIDLTAYPTEDGVRYGVVFQKDAPEKIWAARLELTAAGFRAEQAARAARGESLQCISGYTLNGEPRYAAVWTTDGRGVAPPPRTGELPPEWTDFDRALATFLEEEHVPAATVAVAKNGRLVLSRGYGHLDGERTLLVPPDTPMRLASLTKPMTAAAVRKLVRDSRLKLDAPVFDLLGLRAHPDKPFDARWKQVTVRHLLEHRGGWDRTEGLDPSKESLKIVEELKKPGPPTADDLVGFMLTQPLQFEPGARGVYSNFGYTLLGRVVEKASGRPFFDYLRDDVLKPCGATGVFLGRSLPADRDPREPHYFSPQMGKNWAKPSSSVEVPLCDGGFPLEALDSHGGLVASAPDLLRFLSAYRLDGEPLGNAAFGEDFEGVLPGTFVYYLRRCDGLQVALLFNQDQGQTVRMHGDVREVVMRAADALPR